MNTTMWFSVLGLLAGVLMLIFKPDDLSHIYGPIFIGGGIVGLIFGIREDMKRDD